MKGMKYILIGSTLLLTAGGICILAAGSHTGPRAQGLLLILILLGAQGFGYYFFFRRRFVQFSDSICSSTEAILRGESMGPLHNLETLPSKMIMELEKVQDIYQFRLTESVREKEEVQKVISEISHQLKTPLANIRMYHDMLTEPDTKQEETERFMQVIRGQLDKMEFLIDALAKASRLESELIRLEPVNTGILNTLAAAVSGIARKAERKKIRLSVRCRPSDRVLHDVKWTAEALENILDNAVKYTPDGGSISITVFTGEMYTEIKIEDTGKGIEPSNFNDIFKRFYREPSSAGTEGLGLGLYLSQKIVTLQGGYIRVRSSVGSGSCFSVFLPSRCTVEGN